VSTMCRQHRISEQSHYRWKKLYGNMKPSEARELRQLREENTKLKRLMADLSLDKAMLQDVLQKILKPAPKRHVVKYMMDRYSVGAKRACQWVRLHRSAWCYRCHRHPQTALRERIRALAQSRVRFFYRRISLIFKREGWDVSMNRLYRLYREENLGSRRKRPWRHVSTVHRNLKHHAGGPNDVWGMNFVADQWADGRRIRTLTIVDLFTRECLGIEVGFSLRAEDVLTALNHLKYDRGLPNRFSCDNAAEFSGGMMDQWAYSNQVEIDFSRQEKLTDNTTVESFNGRFRNECLNTHSFDSIDDANEKIDHRR
jgi:putative transposase